MVYAPNRAPEISRMISAILAGYAWDTANPFVEKSEQRLNTLAELVGNFAKVSIRTKDAAPPATVPNAYPFDDDGEDPEYVGM